MTVRLKYSITELQLDLSAIFLLVMFQLARVALDVLAVELICRHRGSVQGHCDPHSQIQTSPLFCGLYSCRKEDELKKRMLFHFDVLFSVKLKGFLLLECAALLDIRPRMFLQFGIQQLHFSKHCTGF